MIWYGVKIRHKTYKLITNLVKWIIAKNKKNPRKCRQNKKNGINQSFEEVLQSIMARDKNDMNKAVGALKKAPDAIYVDSSKSSVNKTKHKIIRIIKQKTNEGKRSVRNDNYKKNIKSNR